METKEEKIKAMKKAKDAAILEHLNNIKKMTKVEREASILNIATFAQLIELEEKQK